jgi:rhamnogalacturonan endolyase
MAFWLAGAGRVFASFGVTSSGGFYTVDTGAALVFKVSQSSGDITSLNYNGTEYQATDKNSQIASGLGTATTVTATTYSTNYIKIAITTDPTNAVVSSLTHYLMVRNGFPNIYMATYVTEEPAVGELRWITRLQFNKIPNGPPQSNNNGNTGAIESTDVFGYADGHTTSKYYGRHRAMDLTYNGATGSGIGVWMIFGNRESSSGGPFYRDIENQGDGMNSDQEVYNYMNSGHEEPEAWRTNVLNGPYALVFSTGAAPSLPVDFSWIESGGLGLTGWVSNSVRGAVSGVAYGVPVGFQAVVGFANTNAQYWATVSSNGTYICPSMKPGTYTATLYKQELPVTNMTVAVASGLTNTLDLVSAESVPTPIFQIGDWDGTPAGFLNGSNIVNMHPQDVRNSTWMPFTYTVGVNQPGDFPSIQMRLTNSPTTILFNLTADQIQNLTLRIGMTCAYNGGRPSATINGNALSNPGASSQPNSRSFTTGTYRGNDTNETYGMPSGDLVVGQNTLTITPISGSSDLGPFLSAGWVYDAVELSIPNTAPAIPPAPTALQATVMNGSEINLAWTSGATNAVNFLVERSIDDINFTLVGAVTADKTNFSDAGLSPGATYYYTVTASNPGGVSGGSNIASATTTVPHFSAISNSGGNLMLSGSGGTMGGPYAVLSSTNLSLPLAQWTVVKTNNFDSNGGFIFTNAISAAVPQSFYQVQIQLP